MSPSIAIKLLDVYHEDLNMYNKLFLSVNVFQLYKLYQKW